MQHKLPPLNALKAFESAARNLSFTKAAAELFITQGAVSKQVKILEEYLGFTLFKRIHQGLELTKKAGEYYEKIYCALDLIRTSTHLACHNKKQEQIININILPSLSAYWLIPIAKSFKEKHPNIQLNITSGDNREIDFFRTKIDIAVRSGEREFNGVRNIKIIDEEMLMVSAPELAKKISNIQDISKMNILQHSCRPNVLKNWMNSVNLDTKNYDNTHRFEHFFMIIEAAKNGLGIAFVPGFLINQSIKKNELVNLLNIKYKTNFTYYLLHKIEDEKNQNIKTFCDFVQQNQIKRLSQNWAFDD